MITNPMLRQLPIFLLSSLLLCGCGNSDLQHPETGLKVHFDGPGRNGVIMGINFNAFYRSPDRRLLRKAAYFRSLQGYAGRLVKVDQL